MEKKKGKIMSILEKRLKPPETPPEETPQNSEERFATLEEFEKALKNYREKMLEITNLEMELHKKFNKINLDNKWTLKKFLEQRADLFKNWSEDAKEEFLKKMKKFKDEEEEIKSSKFYFADRD